MKPGREVLTSKFSEGTIIPLRKTIERMAETINFLFPGRDRPSGHDGVALWLSVSRPMNAQRSNDRHDARITGHWQWIIAFQLRPGPK